jgi:hypothetical protein
MSRAKACNKAANATLANVFDKNSLVAARRPIIEIWDTGGDSYSFGTIAFKDDTVVAGSGSDPLVSGGYDLLSTLQWIDSVDAFGVCGVAGTGPDQPARIGTAYAATINPDTSVAMSGTADYFRILEQPAAGAEEQIMDGTITVIGGGGDIEFDDVAFVAGGTVIITGLAFIIPIECPFDAI